MDLYKEQENSNYVRVTNDLRYCSNNTAKYIIKMKMNHNNRKDLDRIKKIEENHYNFQAEKKGVKNALHRHWN